MLCYIVDLILVVFQIEKMASHLLKDVDLMKFDVVLMHLPFACSLDVVRCAFDAVCLWFDVGLTRLGNWQKQRQFERSLDALWKFHQNLLHRKLLHSVEKCYTFVKNVE